MRALYFSATATAAIVVDVNAVLRSSAAAGGTPSNPTIVANDSNNSASTALITAYATAPTPGTAVGTIGSEKTLVSAPSSSNYIGVVRFLFGESQGSIQPLVLRGASQFLCLNTSALGAGASIDISSIHTED
jgi:hypothetical protein